MVKYGTSRLHTSNFVDKIIYILILLEMKVNRPVKNTAKYRGYVSIRATYQNSTAILVRRCAK
jgi:hypothetical protein